MSLRGRLLAASLALVAVGLTGAGVFTYFAFQAFLQHRLESQLLGATRGISQSLGAGRLTQVLGDQVAITFPGIFFEVLDPQGGLLIGTRNAPAPVLPTPLHIPAEPGQLGNPFSAKSSASGDVRYEVQVSNLGSSTAVVALPENVSKTLANLVWVELLVGLGVLAATAALGSWLVRLGLRPLVEIEGTAGKIAAGDLTERVARADDRTEVGRLGQALNAMMSRIEAAFEERRASEAALRASEERLRRFVSDASHELRTPVASVRAYSELFRRGAARHPEDLPRLMARIESEAARMGLLVEDLLLLTRLDQGRPLEMAPVDLGALAADSVEAARIIDPERPITLHVEGSVEVIGDRDRLRQVTDNLLANVRTHTPPAAAASVTVRLAGDRAIVEVADSGPGIDPEDAEHIFERFFRSDPSRARDRGGSGLGLSIVAAITAAHGGTASATNRPGPGGGAIFTINLPALVEVGSGPASNGAKQDHPDLQAGSEPDHTPGDEVGALVHLPRDPPGLSSR
ncbi:MAG: two-component sensor histidine kinase [Actinobacteria bacterium]|nr:two-component sensor histidine kinase [Actinomycetota bacterium]